jgi:hypothetical protein
MTSHPLSWYADRIAAGDSFTSLLYGDGEFRVMGGENQGRTWTDYRERVTVRMMRELRDAVRLAADPSVLFGTDPNILDYRTYAGGDAHTFQEMGAAAERVLATLPAVPWVDGTVWDAASQHGRLGPFLRALRTRPVVLVANPVLHRLDPAVLKPDFFAEVPRYDAFHVTDDVEAFILRNAIPDAVYLVCCGLGAVPLCARLHGRIPGAAVLDVGGTFDVFVRIGEERGWREAVYRDRAAYDALVRSHLEG